MTKGLAYCIDCGALVSIRETRAAGKCPSCGETFPILVADESLCLEKE